MSIEELVEELGAIELTEGYKMSDLWFEQDLDIVAKHVQKLLIEARIEELDNMPCAPIAFEMKIERLEELKSKLTEV